MEELGARSGTEGVQAFPESVLELADTYREARAKVEGVRLQAASRLRSFDRELSEDGRGKASKAQRRERRRLAREARSAAPVAIPALPPEASASGA